MKTPPAAVYRRLNITLPEDAARLIDRVADKGERSQLIAEAIRYYVRKTDRATLRKRLREGAARSARSSTGSGLVLRGRGGMAAPRHVRDPRRGEVYLVSFDPTLGAEIRKTRPVLILQNDIANRASPITIVAAITSRSDEELYPTEVPIRAREGGLSTDSVVLLNQGRSTSSASSGESAS